MFNFRKKKYKKVVAIIALAVITTFAGARVFPKNSFKSDAQYTYIRYVIDGDTIITRNNEKIRLIGVDTPEYHESDKLTRQARFKGVSIQEIQKKGKKAYKFTNKLVLGKKVLLTLDENNAYIGHRDKYGRLLAYVYILDDKIKNDYVIKKQIKIKHNSDETMDAVFLNATLLNAGYANAYRRYDYKHKKYFLELERKAKRNKSGLWKQGF
jgi:micrococcal nuclease